MNYFLHVAGAQSGPHSLDELREGVESRRILPHDQVWKEGSPAWQAAGKFAELFPPPPIPPPVPAPAPPLSPPPYIPLAHVPAQEASDETLIRRLSDYSRISGIMWVVLGVIQIISVVGMVAGAWNIYAAITRIRAAKTISDRRVGVPAAFQRMTGLIIIGILNLLLGGVIGVIFVAFDFYVRDLVLKNAHLFHRQEDEPVIV